jgi:hypothetical protein
VLLTFINVEPADESCFRERPHNVCDAGVKWFEIDMKDVIAAKNMGLQHAGAQTAPDQQDCQFPLKAASFKNFSADLNRRQDPSGTCSHAVCC